MSKIELPKEPEKMTRKERREWYHRHRKSLKLPRWKDLSKTLK
jgi:hypothetical protein